MAATKAIVLAVIGLIIVYDIIAYWTMGVKATVSRITLAWAQDIPIVAVGVGVVIGHLFWPQPNKKLLEASEREAQEK